MYCHFIKLSDLQTITCLIITSLLMKIYVNYYIIFDSMEDLLL